MLKDSLNLAFETYENQKEEIKEKLQTIYKNMHISKKLYINIDNIMYPIEDIRVEWGNEKIIVVYNNVIKKEDTLTPVFNKVTFDFFEFLNEEFGVGDTFHVYKDPYTHSIFDKITNPCYRIRLWDSFTIHNYKVSEDKESVVFIDKNNTPVIQLKFINFGVVDFSITIKHNKDNIYKWI